MATRRERMEARAERRREWAGKATARSASQLGTVDTISSNIPCGQPILVGHHSERKARRDADRIHTAMGNAVAAHQLAERHTQVATTLESRLATTVFSDDHDAIEALERRIAERESEAARETAVNKAWRKGGLDAVRAVDGITAAQVADAARTMQLSPYLSGPCFVANTRAAIRRDRERLASLRKAVA